jgi:hypothetical protein
VMSSLQVKKEAVSIKVAIPWAERTNVIEARPVWTLA